MKNIRSLLFFLVAVILIMGFTSIAYSEGGDGYNLSLADVDTSTFALNDSLRVWLMHPDTAAYNADDSLKVVSATSDSLPVLKFLIENASTVADTLDVVRFTSANDTTFCFSRIALYREGVTAPLMETTLDTFAMNEEIAFNNIGDEIAADDTAVYYFEVDINTAYVDAGYDSLYAGLKIMGGDIEMVNAGAAPDLGNVLIYTILPSRADGRLLQFDTKPPDLVIEFEHADDDGGGCINNNIVNLGDSIVVYAWDSTGVYEIDYAWAWLEIFGGGADSVQFDTVYESGSDSAAYFMWRIPDTTFTGSDEVASGFYYLKVGAIDASGNVIVDSILINMDIDTEQPVFDDHVIGSDTVHVWSVLSYDANSDGTAAIDDSITFYSYLTSNPFDEIDSVVIDLTGWGVSAIVLDDQAGDRRFSATIEVGAGGLDLLADDSATIYYVTAYDNACNIATDSALLDYAIDNEIPGPPDAFTYERYADNDFNNIVNIGDEVEIEVDASSTTDLDETCGIYVDLFNSGLGGDEAQCIDSASGLFTLQTMVYDGGVNAVDVGANVHNVTITMTDDAGNTEDYTSPNIVFPVDTESPPGIEDLEVTLGPCALNLTWGGDSDDSLYLIFWDGGDGFDTDDYDIDTVYGVEVYNFKDTLGATSDTTWWTTDATITLVHGTTYEFVIRAIDNANNREYNFDRASNTADCVAPVACITYPEMDGGAYGTGNNLEFVAESSDGDIANARLWIRDADIGSSVPGPLVDFGLLTDNGGGVFSFELDSAMMESAFGCVDWHYEAVVQCTDTVGNVRSVPDILADCDYTTFEFDWFCAPLPVALISVNDAVDPQTGCGYDVTRDDQNTVEINVTDFTAGDTYIVDVNVILYNQYTRVYYNDTVTTMPFTFPLDATLFPKGSQDMWVTVTRDDGNTNTIGTHICVPDEDAPMATIVAPTDGQWVLKNCTFMGTINVWAKIDYATSYDFGGTSKVEFYESADGETWTLFDVVTSMTGSDSTWRAGWNNCAYEDGSSAYLRAIFFDDANNTYTTPHIMVSIDGVAPDISLAIEGEKDVCGTATLNGLVDLKATVNTTWEDIDEVYFIYAPADSPDIPSFYRLIGTGVPASNTNIYTYSGFDTEGLVDGWEYRFRAIARDVVGNTMWDYNGDGNMDAYTFDALNKNSDALYAIDNTPVQGAIGHVVVNDGETLVNEFPTPSALLGGTDRVYAQMGHDITVHTWQIPSDDTCCYDKVVYFWDGDPIATSYGPMPFEITFNPVEDGFVDPMDIEDGYVDESLSIEYYDCFGQTTTDAITVYVLDVTANQAVFISPYDGDCVAGNVDLDVMVVDAASVAFVDYYWRTIGGDWNLIGRGMPTITKASGYYPYTWMTAGMTDGAYELGAITTDPSGNSSDPTVIAVTLANTAPTVVITAPADLSYVNNNYIVTADVTGGAPSERTHFEYKAQTSSSWSMFSVDFYEPWSAPFDPDGSDGWYNIRVRSQNCADVWGTSEFITVFLDETAPRARLTSVNGEDAGSNDPSINVTGLSTITVTGYFADDKNDNGNSGLSMVAFYLMNDDEDAVREIILDPATAGFHSATFDITGLGIGEYKLEAWAYDAVGNMATSQTISIYISDLSAPTVAIAGYWNGMLYAYDWSGDAERVLFEYQTEAGWVGIGIGDNTDVSRLWATPWWPSEGTHTLRVLSADDDGNFDDANALTATFVYTDEDNYNFGTTDMTITAKKNHDGSCDMDGVVRVNSELGSPVVIGMYDWGDDHQRIYLDENQQTDGMYYGSFDAGDVYGFDFGFFFASIPNESGVMEITMTSIATHEVYPDFGTNGYVQGPDNMVTLEIPPGAVDGYMTVTVMETWIPEAGIDQDHFSVLGNDDGNGWYIACANCSSGAPITKENTIDDITLDASECCFNDNKYAVITMPYDSEDDTPVDSLAVAHWDSYDNEWEFGGIYYPTFVEGFNAEGNYVEFATECLHGLYAVVSYRTPSHPGPIAIEWVDESSCGYYDMHPSFRLKVYDKTINNSEMDMDQLQVWVDGSPIIEDGDEADFIDWDYDYVSNDLWIWWGDYEYYYYEDTSWNPLTCGDHVFKIGVKNDQGQYAEETFDFSVDCTPPQIVFENGYVGKNPTIEFWVTDDESGVDTSSIHVDVIAVETNNTDPTNPNQDENLFFLQTFFPEQITIGEDGYVQIPTTFELEDERAIVVIIYDGNREEDYNYGDPVGSDDWDAYYEDHHGINDCVGNVQTPVVQILAIDIDPPTIVVVGFDTPGNQVAVLPGTCPVQIKVEDDGEGFEASDITIYEDGLPIEQVAPIDVEVGYYSFTEETGMIEYCPTPGARIEIVVTDGAGNTVSRSFGSGDPTGIVDATLNWNPWNPNDGLLTISYDFTGPATVKIYDFAGDLVKTLTSETGSVMWNGATEDGTRVADGVYFGHIMVETTSGNFSTVVKIALIED